MFSEEKHTSSTLSTSSNGFDDMNLADPVLKTLKDLGYETPTSIQSRIIPHMLAGKDVLGQAQTGTGKTAAFALPLLSSRIDIKKKLAQVLVITPTRELAIQVAESFKGYAARIRNFNVLPIYGGQSYEIQLRQLKRGIHVVVGTPGRLMDHMRRGTLKLDELTCLVLDEADEMLRMGFIDDVKWILEQTPEHHQMALFSATMPPAIRSIARRYLKSPEEVTIQLKTTTADTIRQRFWMVKGTHKLDALTRILEAENFDAMLVFVRTKVATIELADKLEARGYATEALNGDIAQKSRERTIDRFKKGKIDIVVATDVAARGLDVERISHVINYDIPTEAEAYIHRIGRTGRAGRHGDAILFVSPRERWMLRVIEKSTRQKLELMNLPTTRDIANRRIADFKQRITDTLTSEDLSPFRDIVDQFRQEKDEPALDIAAALAAMLYKDKPLFIEPEKSAQLENRGGMENRRRGTTENRGGTGNSDLTHNKVPGNQKMSANQKKQQERQRKEPRSGDTPKRGKPSRQPSGQPSGMKEGQQGRAKQKRVVQAKEAQKREVQPKEAQKRVVQAKEAQKREHSQKKHKNIPLPRGMERFSIAVGHEHGVKPGEIVGAIASEAGLDSKFIGNITISGNSSTVDLPREMPNAIFKILKKTRVAGQQLDIEKLIIPGKMQYKKNMGKTDVQNR